RQRTPVLGVDATTRLLAWTAAVLAYAQIVLGALITHAGWIVPHLLGAGAVFVFVPIVAARLSRAGDSVATPAARALTVLLGLQLLLGVGSFVVRFTPVWIPGGQLTMLALPVAHRLAASLIFGTTVLVGVRALGTPAPRERRFGTRPVLRLVRG